MAAQQLHMDPDTDDEAAAVEPVAAPAAPKPIKRFTSTEHLPVVAVTMTTSIRAPSLDWYPIGKTPLGPVEARYLWAKRGPLSQAICAVSITYKADPPG